MKRREVSDRAPLVEKEAPREAKRSWLWKYLHSDTAVLMIYVLLAILSGTANRVTFRVRPLCRRRWTCGRARGSPDLSWTSRALPRPLRALSFLFLKLIYIRL